jgi:hypothetical protein
MEAPEMENELAEVTFGQQARLVGFDVAQTTFAPGEPLALTLYWQALQTGGLTDYKVFVHLLTPDGRLISQDDTVPNQGQNPTTGWLAGEYITDPHNLPPASETAVTAHIAVGLYDPQTNERLLLSDGRDFYILPVEITLN